MSRRLVYRAIYIPSLLAIAGMTTLFAHPARSRAAFNPKDMKAFTAEDKSFAVSYPSAWKVSVSTLNGTGTRAHFKRDATSEVVVTCDLAGSLMLDLSKLNASSPGLGGANSSLDPNTNASVPPASSRSTGMSGAGGVYGTEGLPGMGGAGAKTPLQSAHQTGAGYMMSKFRHYKQETGVPSQLAGGTALTSAFTANTPDFISPQDIVGRHITALVGNRPVTIDAYCVKGENEDDLFRALGAMLPTLRVNETAQ